MGGGYAAGNGYCRTGSGGEDAVTGFSARDLGGASYAFGKLKFYSGACCSLFMDCILS